ncbi:hypothetical protein BC939DRAFT_456911 [Gamsiella multidivaricata]|uniref:uncharacterized protein n=1 Tax=Gamsiella multidivaricata TaxID=101098 RepID=UPI002220C14E|nr:uncharacterized protein BC939DRAFT_456911 [Gamsiella multidivaricata]KAG0366400.1 hypothetical protein BGZ54_005388 [Gamsiella multidivaricata]KAI7820773.1 hypothetical protein BC939DRAFT_456911 [Gamsiella multidivaricata]
MKFIQFIPAALALSFFCASTQALPTIQHQEKAVDILKRGNSNAVDAVIKVFVDAEAKILAKACVDLEVAVCADLIVKVNANANVLGGLVKVNANVKDLEVRAKAAADAEIKAMIKADAKALVLANIDAHVRAVVDKICPVCDHVCLNKNARTIVAKVDALIKVDVAKLAVKVKADAAVHAKVRVSAFIKDLSLRLGVANADIHAIVRIRSDIDIHVKAFIELCAKLFVKAGLVAKVAAL